MRRAALALGGLWLAACGAEGEDLFGVPAASPSGTGGATGVTTSGSSETATGSGGASSGPSASATSGSSAVTGTSASTTSAAGSTVASTGSGASSASGGGADVCGPKDVDTDCISCIKTACCNQLETCVGEKPCACMLACTLSKDSNCGAKCSVGWNYEPWTKLRDCRNLSCAVQCLF